MESLPIIPPIPERVVEAVRDRVLLFSSVVIHHAKTFDMPEDELQRMRLTRQHLLMRLGCLDGDTVLPLAQVLKQPNQGNDEDISA